MHKYTLHFETARLGLVPCKETLVRKTAMFSLKLLSTMTSPKWFSWKFIIPSCYLLLATDTSKLVILDSDHPKHHYMDEVIGFHLYEYEYRLTPKNYEIFLLAFSCEHQAEQHVVFNFLEKWMGSWCYHYTTSTSCICVNVCVVGWFVCVWWGDVCVCVCVW